MSCAREEEVWLQGFVAVDSKALTATIFGVPHFVPHYFLRVAWSTWLTSGCTREVPHSALVQPLRTRKAQRKSIATVPFQSKWFALPPRCHILPHIHSRKWLWASLVSKVRSRQRLPVAGFHLWFCIQGILLKN